MEDLDQGGMVWNRRVDMVRVVPAAKRRVRTIRNPTAVLKPLYVTLDLHTHTLSLKHTFSGTTTDGKHKYKQTTKTKTDNSKHMQTMEGNTLMVLMWTKGSFMICPIQKELKPSH